MDRGAWWAAGPKVTKSDTTEVTHTHTCTHAHIRSTVFKTKRNISYTQAWNLKSPVSEMFSGKSPVPWRAPINQQFS